MTADPRIVTSARKRDWISYEEMLEMAACGAKILHLRCVEYARRYGIPIHVRCRVELWQYNRFVPDRRTQSRNVDRQITYNPLTKEYKVVSLKSEHREPYLTKDLREAQRVISEFRIGNLLVMLQMCGMPHDLTMKNIHLFAEEVLPAAREIHASPLA